MSDTAVKGGGGVTPRSSSQTGKKGAAIMAPSNIYLEDVSAQQRLTGHNNRLIKKTTIEFVGETPEVHWDFNRSVEQALLAQFLNRFAEPDFVDGKVTLKDAAVAVYGNTDDYLNGRVVSMLHPASAFNKEHSLNGLVHVFNSSNNTVIRGDRIELAEYQIVARGLQVGDRAERSGAYAGKQMQAALKKAKRIAPDHAPELEAKAGEIESGAVQRYQAALGSGS